MQWVIAVATVLLMIEKIGRSLVWLNDDENDCAMMGVWGGFRKLILGALFGTWQVFVRIWWILKAIGRGLILAWSCVVFWGRWVWKHIAR